MTFTLIPTSSTLAKGYIRKGMIWIETVDTNGNRRFIGRRITATKKA
jgi:hypothetical protein